MREIKVTVDNKTVVRVLSLFVAFVLGLLFLYWARTALMIIALSFFLALALNPSVSFFASKMPRGSRVLGTGIAYLIVLSIIGTLIYIMVPPLIKQTTTLVDRLPDIVEDIQSEDNRIGDFIRRYKIDDEIDEFVANATDKLGDTDGLLFKGVTKTSSIAVTLLTVIVMTFLMLVEGPTIAKKFWALHARPEREHHKKLAAQMYSVVTGYVNGQLLIALLGATFALIIMLILGIPYAIPLAGLMTIFGLIPMVGTTIGAIVLVFAALFESFADAAILAIAIIVYQQVENSVIQPYIQSRTLSMSPLLVFIAVVFGFALGGIVAALVAIPVAGCLRVLFLDYLDRKQLKERLTLPKVKAKKT